MVHVIGGLNVEYLYIYISPGGLSGPMLWIFREDLADFCSGFF